ncbi:MAG: 1,3-beta-galactosyl-N-acetylhexosamine phosphorylase [Dorea sp.]|nr:1,3-beta-galactosyl-N-acetylhexosamine phosphorylase [Dorea sp.]
MSDRMRGRVTIPTDVDVVPETLELVKRWGADAIRDCDGTEYPEELRNVDAKVYSTYYTTRKDNEWAKAHPEEIQQMYIMTPFYNAEGGTLRIHLMNHLYPDMLAVNSRDDIKKWWEVIDRTTGEIVSFAGTAKGGCEGAPKGEAGECAAGREGAVSETVWRYEEEAGDVVIDGAKDFHDYTVSFLAYIMWDPVHMYNAVTNDWKGVEKQITFDVRQPKTKAFSMERLRRYIAENPHIDVIRYTTFFHQFTLIFDESAREKYVDWYGYSASVSPYILEQFEQEAGYPFRPEYIIDQGYMNNTYRVPSKEFLDFQAFQRREVAKLAKEMVDITHECGKEAMMFLGDHWIGMEPFMDEFKSIGLDAVVGSVGNGATLRLISDIEGVKYTEGRFLPYFFPDTFHEGGDPVKEAKVNWVTARRAILRKPIDRIGYGGYLKLAMEFPEFIDYVEEVCKEFRLLYENIKGTTPHCVKRAAVLNSWGRMRAWGNHMVHHALYYKQNYSYAGIIEALSGAPFDVKFISFDDIRENPSVLDDIDVILNVGDAYTAYTGGENWKDERIVTAVKRFVHRGGGFIGVGEPAAYQWQGRFFQLSGVLGVEEETGFTLNVDKYNWDEHTHFITEDCQGEIDFGEGKKNIFALDGTTVICQRDKEVQLAVNTFGEGRGVYISGLPYSFENSRLLYRAILWASGAEDELKRWFSSNYNVEVHAYIKNGKYCVVNNTYEPQSTTVYKGDGTSFELELEANEIVWYEI